MSSPLCPGDARGEVPQQQQGGGPEGPRPAAAAKLRGGSVLAMWEFQGTGLMVMLKMAHRNS